MTVLSLFDGMGCGVLAMMESGVPIDRYVAYEIDKYAIQTSQHNFPFIEHRGDVFKADFTEFEGFDWLIAGFPCTKFSIAQKNDRETQPYQGEGWDLFWHTYEAINIVKPKYFLLENNKSMAKAVQEEISRLIGFKPVLINSALVSAQNRQRLYWVGRRNEDGTYSKVDVQQPEDRGILLKDILEDGCCVDKDKAYCLKHQAGNARDCFKKHHTQIKFEPCILGYPRGKNEGGVKYEKTPTMTANSWQTNNHVVEPVTPCGQRGQEKSRTITASYQTCSERDRRMDIETDGFMGKQGVAEPVFMGEVPEHKGTYRNGKQASQQYRVYDTNAKGVAVTTCAITNVAEPVRVGCLPSPDGEVKNSQAFRVYDSEGKSVTLSANGGGAGGKTGLYAVPVNTTVDEKSHTIKAQYYKNGTANFITNPGHDASAVAEPLNVTPEGKSQTIKAQYQQPSPANILGYTSTYGASGVAEHCPCFAIPLEWDEEGRPTKARSCADGKIYTVYEVKDKKINIKGKEYPIKLPDGFYIIRKLTVRECMRLQTVPEWYEFPVSDSQAYKMLGNGWTVAVISWIIDCALK